jgi:hypothetical protein
VIRARDLQGHWHRAWLRAPGLVDHDTSVHWMQCGATYADIRIPLERPDTRGASALSDLSPAALHALRRAEGFAGDIALKDGICTWHRRISWHGTPRDTDAGHLRFDGEGALHETGVHADYSELWHRTGRGPRAAFALADDAGRRAYLLSVGARFVIGIGRPLTATDAPAKRPDPVAAIFEDVYAFGHWTGTGGVADLCTNPLLEGDVVLTRNENGFVWHGQDFHGQARNIPLTRTAARHVAA